MHIVEDDALDAAPSTSTCLHAVQIGSTWILEKDGLAEWLLELRHI